MKRPKKKKNAVFVKKLLVAQLQNGDFFKMELLFLIDILKNSAPKGSNSLSSSNTNSSLFLIRGDMEQTHKDISLLGSH